MTIDDLYLIIGRKEAELVELYKMNNVLTKELEAARAQLQELGHDRNSSL